MFESKSIGDLISIAAAGGGMEIEVSARSTGDLTRLATAAASGNARIYMRGLTARSTGDLASIARAGRGYVVFADPLRGN